MSRLKASSQPRAFAFGRGPAATATSTGIARQTKLAGRKMRSDLSGRIHSGSGLVGASQPQTKFRQGSTGRSA